MDSTIINRMCRALPSPQDDVVRDNFRIRSADSQVGIDDPEVGRFASAYKDLQFGWHFARTMALNRMPLMIPLRDRNNWVWRAFLYCLDRDRYRDSTIMEVMALMGAGYAKERSVINALLVSSDMDIDKVAHVLKRPVDLISAYEILFFNIFDRRKDDFFLSSIIYPQGRTVEFFDNYTVNEALDVLLLRAGYNNGTPHVLHMAGFPPLLVSRYLTADAPQRLEAMIMANGLIMAMNGFINQGPQVTQGIRTSIQLMSAAKAGGKDGKDSPFQGTGGQVLMAELQRVKAAHHQARTMAFYDAQERQSVQKVAAASAN